jgi:ATP phosphoribosyltransferase regulatory subunit
VRAPGVEISFDLAELGGFNYESGIVFAAFAPGSPDAIARGGRYDEVGSVFGRRAAGDGIHDGPAAARGPGRQARAKARHRSPLQRRRDAAGR